MTVLSDRINVVTHHTPGVNDVGKDKKNANQTPKPEGATRPHGTRLEPHVAAALDKFVHDQPYKVSHSAIIAAAVLEFLIRQEYLPPVEDD